LRSNITSYLVQTRFKLYDLLQIIKSFNELSLVLIFLSVCWPFFFLLIFFSLSVSRSRWLASLICPTFQLLFLTFTTPNSSLNLLPTHHYYLNFLFSIFSSFFSYKFYFSMCFGSYFIAVSFCFWFYLPSCSYSSTVT